MEKDKHEKYKQFMKQWIGYVRKINSIDMGKHLTKLTKICIQKNPH